MGCPKGAYKFSFNKTRVYFNFRSMSKIWKWSDLVQCIRKGENKIIFWVVTEMLGQNIVHPMEYRFRYQINPVTEHQVSKKIAVQHDLKCLVCESRPTLNSILNMRTFTSKYVFSIFSSRQFLSLKFTYSHCHSSWVGPRRCDLSAKRLVRTSDGEVGVECRVTSVALVLWELPQRRALVLTEFNFALCYSYEH